MMNRIGLLTIHDTINFGSQLQTFSLYKAVESLGHDVCLIDYKCEAISNRESTLSLSEAKNFKDVIKSLLLHNNLEKRKNNFWSFLQSNLNMTEPYNRETISKTNELFDRFLIGSDIVWGLNITGNDYTYMLDFVDEPRKRLAFSSSVGTKWDPSEEATVYKYLSKFDDIAVRESDAAMWVGELLGKKIEITCDPTMLWDADFWCRLSGDKSESSHKYILVYMSDPENRCIKRALEYGKLRHLPVYYINYRAPILGTVDMRPTSLQEWLTLFKNAEVVFSASFHGLLYALYFHKKFYYFNWVNKSRMDSLARAFQIEYREGTNENLNADIPIDYELIDRILKEKRDYSWNKLRNMLL